MKNTPRPESAAWQAGWTETRGAQLDRTLAATPSERLAWLEEMIRGAFLAGALPRREVAEPGQKRK